METSPDDIQWNQMSLDQRRQVALNMARMRGVHRFIVGLVAAALMAQPMWQAYFKNQDAARAADISKTEKASESALALSQAAISQVTNLSSQLGELRAENQKLRSELNFLQTKYEEVESAYKTALAERAALKARLDKLTK